MSDEWYALILEFLLTGHVISGQVLEKSVMRIIKRALKQIVLIDNSELVPPKQNEMAYKERNGTLSKCILQSEVKRYLEILHDVYGHFVERITRSRAIGVAWWPTRNEDIFKYCRSCAACQMVGPLRPSQGLLLILFMQLMDCVGLDYIGPFTPISAN
jgi:hypothetical protein